MSMKPEFLFCHTPKELSTLFEDECEEFAFENSSNQWLILNQKKNLRFIVYYKEKKLIVTFNHFNQEKKK